MLIFCIILLFVFVYLPLHIYFLETKWLPGLRLWLKIFYKLEVNGLENLPKSGSYLLACNHYSFLDWLIIMKVIPRPVHFIIYYAYYKAFGLNLILKKVNAIPISGGRKKPKLITQAFLKVSEDLNNNKVVLIFPEGGITRDGKIQKFQKGLIHIKNNSDVPLIPISIDGLWGSAFSYSRPGLFAMSKLIPKFKRRKITVTIHCEFKDYKDLNKLKEIIFSKVNHKNNEYILT